MPLRSFLFLLFIIMLCADAQAQPAGYDEEELPSMTRMVGHVRKMRVSIFHPVSNADTLGAGGPDELYIYTFDTAGHILRIEYKALKYKREPDMVITFKYFGRDSVISSEPRGGSYVHKMKTVYAYDEHQRIASKTVYVSQHPRTLRPVRFLASVTNVYDRSGFIVKQLHMGESGRVDMITGFENDIYGNHIAITPPTLDRFGSAARATYKYDAHNNPIYTNAWTYRYTYDDRGNWTRLTQYMDQYLHDANTGGFSKLMTREITYY